MGVRGERIIKTQSVDEKPILDNVEEVLKAAKKKGLIKGDKVDIEAIVKDAGIDILYEELPRNMSGYLKKNNQKWVIGINKLHNIRRKRFTLAHEFAHYILHKDETKYFEDITFFRNNDVSSIEYKANEFAARLLMPANLVHSIINSGVTRIDELADRFYVSVLAMSFRLKELGYNIVTNE